jgi:hypothetical protein
MALSQGYALWIQAILFGLNLNQAQQVAYLRLLGTVLLVVGIALLFVVMFSVASKPKEMSIQHEERSRQMSTSTDYSSLDKNGRNKTIKSYGLDRKREARHNAIAASAIIAILGTVWVIENMCKLAEERE